MLWQEVRKLSRSAMTDNKDFSIINNKIREGTSSEEFTMLKSWKDIPNCSNFRITKLSPYHPILLKNGIFKRTHPAEFDIQPYINGKMNKYLNHQFRRLYRHLGNPRLFWRVASVLLNKSSSYLVMCYNELRPNWHRDLPYGVVWHHFIEYYKTYIWKSKAHEYKFKIVRLPEEGKPEGRPLSVPDFLNRWRHRMLYHIQLVHCRPYIADNQHGFIPGRGTLTAWQTILENDHIKKPFVYEYDFKKFYDSIDLSSLRNLLRDLQTADWMIDELITDFQTLPVSGEYASHQRWESEIHGLNKYCISLYGQEYNRLPLADQSWIISDYRSKKPDYNEYYGLGQGSPISPLLAALILNDPLSKYPDNIIQYADDGIIVGHHREEIQDIITYIKNNSYNIEFAPAPKSEYIIENGVYKKPFRFVGLSYIPGANQNKFHIEGYIHKHHRSGSPGFAFTDYDLLYDVIQYNVSQGFYGNGMVSHNGGINFVDIMMKHMFGYLQNRIYHGDMNLDAFSQNFHFSYINQSWSDLVEKELSQGDLTDLTAAFRDQFTLTLFNSSSFACHQLIRRVHKKLHQSKSTW